MHPEARIGRVDLNVRDVDAEVAWYGETLGLRVLRESSEGVDLGSDAPIVRLVASEGAAPRPPRSPGLYHQAILLPTRADLARFVKRLVETRTPVDGASDHLVSEAIYLSDPEGNGIEVYADRPRASWQRRDGGLHMTTAPLDVPDLLAQAGDAAWRGAPAGTTMGHVHLQVAEVPRAESFYRDAVGFDLTARYGADASFLSAGGYHHHLGINAWGSRAAPPAPPGSLGLREYEILVPDAESLDDAAERLSKLGHAVDRHDGAVHARDPSGNALRIARA